MMLHLTTGLKAIEPLVIHMDQSLCNSKMRLAFLYIEGLRYVASREHLLTKYEKKSENTVAGHM